MAGILLSRVLGFVREWVVAHQVGSNAMTDAYYAAFTLPDFLNYLVAGASLSVTFIPVFTKYAAEGREDEGWHVFSTVMTFMGLLLVGLVLAGEVFAPQLAQLIAPGFPPEEKARVIFLTRLMLPAQFCFYQGSILSAVQYAKRRFVIPSLAPVVYNVLIILGGVFLASRIGMTGFAVGVLAGAVIGNFLLQVYGAIDAGARFKPNLDVLHPGFRLFVRLSVPIMLALSLAFTDDWIIRWFGSYLQPASITWLSYAKTLMRVPLGVVGQGVGVASFPFLAQLYSEGKFDELNRLLNSTMKGLIATLVPDIGAHHCAERTRRLSGFFPHPHASARPRRDGRNARLLHAWFVWLGCAVHSCARFLRHAQHLDSRRRGHGTDLRQLARLLASRAPRPASWIGDGQLHRNHSLYRHYFLSSLPSHT